MIVFPHHGMGDEVTGPIPARTINLGAELEERQDLKTGSFVSVFAEEFDKSGEYIVIRSVPRTGDREYGHAPATSHVGIFAGIADLPPQ